MTLKKVSFTQNGLEYGFELTNPKDLKMHGETNFFWKFKGIEKDGLDVEDEFYSFANDPDQNKLLEFVTYLYGWAIEHMFTDVSKLEKALNEEVKKWKF